MSGPSATGTARSEQPRSPEATAHGWGSSQGALVDDHDAVLLDLDGVVYVGAEAVAGAVEAVQAVRGRGRMVAFVTNNAARTPQDVARHLTELGVQAAPDDVVTSAQAGAAMLAAQLAANAPVLVVGAEGLRQAVTAEGLRPVDTMADEPVAVIQGFSPQLTWSMLVEACVAVRSGMPWVATNLDSTLPTPRGLAPGNGAFVDVVARTTGAQPQVAGKPARPLLDTAVTRSRSQRPLFVGDRLDTDMAGARAAAMPGLHVLTGVSAAADLLAAAPAERPSYLGADLAALLMPHRAPERRDGGWRGGTRTDVRARWDVRAGALEVHAPEPSAGGDDSTQVALEVLRVSCAAVWSVLDRADAVPADDGTAPGSDGRGEVDHAQVRAAIAAWTAPFGWDR